MDNEDGTVTDNQTGLQWEKKTTAVASGENYSDPHDVDNVYNWSSMLGGTSADGTVYTDFLSRLNTCTSVDGVTVTASFAGHCDWRLPTIAELRTIYDPTQGVCGGGGGACIDPSFGPTWPATHWSSSAYANNPAFTWNVTFQEFFVTVSGKFSHGYVRAVRGGS